MHFREWKILYFDWISLTFIARVPIDNTPALVSIMACCRVGDKPLSEPMRTWFTDAYVRHWGQRPFPDWIVKAGRGWLWIYLKFSNMIVMICISNTIYFKYNFYHNIVYPNPPPPPHPVQYCNKKIVFEKNVGGTPGGPPLSIRPWGLS